MGMELSDVESEEYSFVLSKLVIYCVVCVVTTRYWLLFLLLGCEGDSVMEKYRPCLGIVCFQMRSEPKSSYFTWQKTV